MTLDHKTIKEMLTEYLHGKTSGEMNALIQSHLEACTECREELTILTDLLHGEVPDPGDLFWKTLPQRVKATVEEKPSSRFSLKAFFLRPIAAGISILILAAVVYTFTTRNSGVVLDPFFEDPFQEAFLDYGEISESAIPSISINLAVNDLDITEEAFVEYSYDIELALLSPDELDEVYKKLTDIKEIGG